MWDIGGNPTLYVGYFEKKYLLHKKCHIERLFLRTGFTPPTFFSKKYPTLYVGFDIPPYMWDFSRYPTLYVGFRFCKYARKKVSPGFSWYPRSRMKNNMSYI